MAVITERVPIHYKKLNSQISLSPDLLLFTNSDFFRLPYYYLIISLFVLLVFNDTFSTNRLYRQLRTQVRYNDFF